jgi:hypothetical protein
MPVLPTELASFLIFAGGLFLVLAIVLGASLLHDRQMRRKFGPDYIDNLAAERRREILQSSRSYRNE